MSVEGSRHHSTRKQHPVRGIHPLSASGRGTYLFLIHKLELLTQFTACEWRIKHIYLKWNSVRWIYCEVRFSLQLYFVGLTNRSKVEICRDPIGLTLLSANNGPFIMSSLWRRRIVSTTLWSDSYHLSIPTMLNTSNDFCTLSIGFRNHSTFFKILKQTVITVKKKEVSATLLSGTYLSLLHGLICIHIQLYQPFIKHVYRNVNLLLLFDL